jgi:hypothetical protein
MATAKVAIGSIMDTITQTAISVSSLVNTTNKGIGMLDALVTKVSDEQRLRYRADRHVFIKNLIRESSESQTAADLQVISFCSKSKEHKEMFEKNFDEFSNLFAEELPTKPQE